ncbi:MAG: hypothetical protein ACOCUV_01235 [bacterium]
MIKDFYYTFLKDQNKITLQKLNNYVKELPKEQLLYEINQVIDIKNTLDEIDKYLLFFLKERYTYNQTFLYYNNKYTKLQKLFFATLYTKYIETTFVPVDGPSANIYIEKFCSYYQDTYTCYSSIFKKILKSDDAYKLNNLKHNFGDINEIQFTIDRSFVLSTCTATFLSCNNGILILLSRRTPIDAIVLPGNIVIYGEKIKNKKELLNYASLYTYILREPGILESPINNNRKIVNYIKDKRPYHVLCEELYGSFLAYCNSNIKFQIGYNFFSSFIELKSLPFQAILNSRNNYNRLCHQNIYFMNIQNTHSINISSKYINWLITIANQYYSRSLLSISDDRHMIWIGIAGGEKRYWKEEVEGLSAVVEWAREKFPGCRFVFDGWTSTANPSEKELEQIKQHKAILDKICKITHLTKDDYLSTIGSQIFRKIALSNSCCFFVCAAGTPAIWPSLICKLPGIVHGTPKFYEMAKPVLVMENILRVPSQMTIVYRENMFKNRPDFENYSILPNNIIECCEKIFNTYFAEN